MVNPLTPEHLRHAFDPRDLDCDSSDQVKVRETIIGQERAVRSLELGLGVKGVGFNIYVAGLPGTGRTTAIEHFLKRVARSRAVPNDWCYVNNFDDPNRPKALSLPAGRAAPFRDDVRGLVTMIKSELTRSFESNDYSAKRQETVRSFEQKRNGIFARIDETAREQGFAIKPTPVGLMTIPLADGQPITDETIAAYGKEEKEALEKRREALQAEVQKGLREVKALERGANEALQELDQEVARNAIDGLVADVKSKYADVAGIGEQLDAMRADILANLAEFRSADDDREQVPLALRGAKDAHLRKFQVNVLVDNSALEGAPVVMELNPTYNNLLGRIEQEATFGALRTDFTLIREGSLHRANGGFLVVPADEVLRNAFAWDGLKRALRNEQIVIEDVGERLGFLTTRGLRLEPIALSTKVILFGRPEMYQLLLAYDEDFTELFKVKADFDSRMDRNRDAVNDYVAFVCGMCENNGLRHLDRSALAKIVEHGSRMAGDREKLSTRFGEIGDVLREASHYADTADAPYVTGAHVQRAIEAKRYRSGLIRERVNEMIAQDTVRIDVVGNRVGQVNGLAVIDLGDAVFGRPSRITATISLGQEGLVDIEREAKLGGPIHTKGVLILAGFLAERYAQSKPLSLSARLVFEQSYSGVEGDSASSTEAYALMSSLSGAPVSQSIAVTGSVNQKGEVQAIGGVNEKIEGFFDVCQVKGLTGEQGVMIPSANVRNLMLREDVVAAVAEGRFRVWPVSTIDEGIEILTGLPAGSRLDDGWEAGSINDRVDRRLREMAETLRKFGKDAKDNGAAAKPAAKD